MKVFIICSVRGASEEYRAKLETYVSVSPVVVHIINKKNMEEELINDIAESAIGAMFQALEKLREIGIERHSTACPVAEMTMDGVDVQVQVMITPNKADWLEGNETAARKVFPFGDTMIN